MTTSNACNASPASPGREWLLARIPWVVALATLLVTLITERGGWPVGVFYDDGIYLDLARSLVAGEGYRHGALPGSPAGIHYPPLFPIWLAVWSSLRSLFGPHDVVAWLKLGNALLAALSVALWAIWGTRRLGVHPVVAALVAAASLLIIPARAVTSTLFSEPLSWVLLALALLTTGSPLPDESPRRPWRAMGSVVPAALLAVARSILLPFTVAAAWASLRDRDEGRGTRAIAVVICLLPTALWAMWTLWHASAIPDGWAASYGSYTAMWRESWSTPGDLLQLVVRQAAGFARIAAAIWSPLGALLALLLGIAGLARLWTRQRWVVAGLGGYVLLVLLWPIEPDRFVWGVLPLLALLCAGGAAHLAERLRARPMLRYATLLTVALPVGACGRWTANGYRNDGWIVPQEIASRNASPLVSWGRTLPRDAVVLTGNDPLFALATGLRAAPALPPDLGEAGGRQLLSPATRLERSACALGHGWLAAGDSADQVAVALRQLLASPGGRLAVTERVQLNGRGEAWKFSCSQ